MSEPTKAADEGLMLAQVALRLLRECPMGYCPECKEVGEKLLRILETVARLLAEVAKEAKKAN